MARGKLQILNWNVAGAKYLELKGASLGNRDPKSQSREAFRKQLNVVLKDLIRRDDPDVVTLQEVVRYSEGGDPKQFQDVIDVPDGYSYWPVWLIDTQHHSATGKWDSVREAGEWSGVAYFAQGNATLVKKSIGWFRPFDLPAIGRSPPDWEEPPIETVKLESGLYLGDRNTEPRAAIVSHLVLDQLPPTERGGVVERLNKPLDIFVVNLHLTTLLLEREGIPGIDEEASQTRLRQLDIVLNGIVSRYNIWRKEGYRWRKESKKSTDPLVDQKETNRHSPIWMIVGDFNFTLESFEYQTLLRRGFIDMVANHAVGTKTSGLGATPTLTVDYAFAGPRFEAIDPKDAADYAERRNRVEVNSDTEVSDHFPLIVSVPITLEA